MSDFQQFIANERERLTKLKTELASQVKDLETQITAADRELKAIDAYENARAGTFGTVRARGTRKNAVLTILKNNPGLTARELKERMGITGDKSLSGSIANLLSTMKKAKEITQVDGKYAAA